MLHIRLLLHVIAGAVAAYPHDIVDIDNILHQMRILIDHGNSVLNSQITRQGNAHFPSAHNDDPHTVFRPFLHRGQSLKPQCNPPTL